MAEHPDSRAVVALLAAEADSALQSLIRRAYEAGYKAAYEEVQRNLSQTDLTTLLSSVVAQAITMPPRLQMKTLLSVDTTRQDLKPSVAHEYGAISNAVREIMRSAPRRGLLIQDVVNRATHDLEVPVTVMQAREALKRLKNVQQVDCIGRRWWVATDKLRGEAAEENGAPSGHAASAPEDREGYQPSLIESQEAARPLS